MKATSDVDLHEPAGRRRLACYGRVGGFAILILLSITTYHVC